MDQIDLRILSLLQDNARISNSEIARQIGMVPSGILERIRKLEENGTIRDYTANLNAETLNQGLLAFILVRTTKRAGHTNTATELAKIPDILEVHHVAGEDCYLLKTREKDTQSLGKFMREKIGALPSVTSTRTIIVLETIKESSKINLAEKNINQ
jgi:Lrp/AsnC family leucine-responsive transcriptional regulator